MFVRVPSSDSHGGKGEGGGDGGGGDGGGDGGGAGGAGAVGGDGGATPSQIGFFDCPVHDRTRQSEWSRRSSTQSMKEDAEFGLLASHAVKSFGPRAMSVS